MSERIVQLPSGLTVAVEPMPSTRAVSIGVWIGVGARDEPAEVAGVSHFLEHLLFKGTDTRSATQISQSVDRVGGDINAYTSKEYTTFYCRVPARVVDFGIELLGDVLTAPAFRDADIASERQVILDELAMDDDSPEDVVHRVFAEQVFDSHALGRETAGERGTVGTVSGDQIRRFFAERYRAGNTVVAIAGAVDADDVIDRVEKAFAALAPGYGRTPRDAPGGVGRSLELEDETEQMHIVVGGRSLRRDDPDREALDVVNHVLGGGLSSRLFDEIRERRGLAYSVFSNAAAYADSGMWSVYAGTLPDNAEIVRRLITNELDRLVSDGITDEELAVAQGYLTGSYEMGLEDSSARMSRLGGQLTVLGRVRPVEEQIARWEAVTLPDTERVIGRVYAPPPLTVTLGPRAARSRVAASTFARVSIRVGVNGAGGRMGSTVCDAVAADPELTLAAGVDPSAVGRECHGLSIARELRAFADSECDVVVDFTMADAVRVTLPWLAMHGVHAVVGTTGLSAADIDGLRATFGDGKAHCLIAPNFAISAVLMMRFAELAAPYFDTAEVIEYHHDRKIDAPSGTAVSTAERIAAARGAAGWAPDPTEREVLPGARGGISGGAAPVRVHAVRMRGMVAHQDVIFGAAGQSLTIRQDSYDRESFMPGVLVACKRIADHPGLTVGLGDYLDV